MDARLVGYLRQYGQRFTVEQLWRSLRADGWPDADIEAAMAEVGLTKPPPLPFEQRWNTASQQRGVQGEFSGMRPLARGHPPLETNWRPLEEKAAPLAAQPPAGGRLAQSMQRGASLEAPREEKHGFLSRLRRKKR